MSTNHETSQNDYSQSDANFIINALKYITPLLRRHVVRKRRSRNIRPIIQGTASFVRAVYGSLHTLNDESKDIACRIADNIILDAQRSRDTLDLVGQYLRTKDARVCRLWRRYSVKGNEYIVALIRIVFRIGEQQNSFDVVETPRVV
jgi:hypothetical protein